MENSSVSSDQAREHICFQTWMNLQELDLSELLQAINIEEADGGNREDLLRQLVEKNIKHFEEYMDSRIHLARDDVAAFFAPNWCSSLESSLLWLSGCRPSLYIRLVYTLCGLKIESQLAQFLEGVRTGNDLGELSSNQLRMIDNLQSKTIKEEQKLSDKMASLQEGIGDHPIAEIAEGGSETYCEPNRDADNALTEHEKSMVTILEEADKLRLNTLKGLTSILTPVEAVGFMAASRKLHLCIHKWGLKRDHIHGRN